MLKRCLIICSVLLNIAFIFYACTKQQVSGKDEAGAGVENTTARFKTAGANEPVNTCYGPFNGMPYADVLRMINNYNTRQYVAIRNGLGFNDAKTCWFEITKLKNFICQAESILEQSGCPLKISGVRFHYAAHDQQSIAAYQLPQNYLRLHTLIMVPTYYDPVARKHFDFNPFVITANSCTPVALGRRMNDAGGVLVGGVSAPAGNIFAEDTGQLGPPDEDGIGKTTSAMQP
jgi:hypothetical protein